MRCVFTSAAKSELSHAKLYYDEQSPGLGTVFVTEVEQTLSTIAVHPVTWAPIYRDIRRCSVKRFPFWVLYRIKGETILIVAVAHQRRAPNYWRNRL